MRRNLGCDAMRARPAAVLFFALALAWPACSPPRIFQATVPPPILKPEAQVESERVAADLIARKIEAPVELKPVAVSLASSLGAPVKSLVDVKIFDLPAAAHTADADLRAGMVAMQKELRDVNIRLAKLQGKPIEGTGLNLLGPSTVLIVGGLIALGVAFPPAFTVMAFLYRRMRATAGHIVTAIDDVGKDPATAETLDKLKTSLSARMDRAHRNVVHGLQKP